ncbi:tetratricopeptide repeat protein [Athalassotoga saccharophila]|uniref:tetratricopeptide repeat protein n=1 Tax=Athalassotoga saccharophila TaxID=1441386 RepID=UPI001379E57D|nr:tetratricopeptide repeat protein [Athalassotoga saccharophila]BBJ28913.1 lipopolysaccharide assembly protein B [Athalassotoga saccharophila]
MKVIFYLSLDPQKAKEENLPVSLPLIGDDFEKAVKSNRLDPDMILRGLRAQIETGKKVEYYLPYLVYFLYDRARFFINEGNMNMARELVGEAASYKKDYRYPLHLGIIERIDGNLERSEILLKEALAMNSEYLPTRLELARTLMEEKEYEEAIEVCKRALEIDPSFSLFYVVMGDAYLASGDYNSAIALYRQSLSIDGTLPVHWRIGVAANALQKFSLAEKEFRSSIESNEGNLNSRYNLSYALYRQGKIFEAIEILRSLVKENKLPEFFTELVILEKIAGLYEEALKDVEEGLSLGIEEEGFLVAAIDLYALNGMIERALELCEKLPEELSSSRKTLIEFQDEWDLTIELLEVAKYMNTGNSMIKKRIEEIKAGYIGKETIFDLSMLKIVEIAIEKHNLHFYSAESFITRASLAFSGSFDVTALLTFLYRVYFYIHALGYTTDESIDQIIPQISDISWKIGSAIAKVMDERHPVTKKTDVKGIAEYITYLMISEEVDPDLKDLIEMVVNK